jgi:hypothetical protein
LKEADALFLFRITVEEYGDRQAQHHGAGNERGIPPLAEYSFLAYWMAA